MASRMTTGGKSYVVVRNPAKGEYELVSRVKYPYIVIEGARPLLRLVKFVDFMSSSLDPIDNGFVVACSRPYEGERITYEGYASVIVEVMDYAKKSGIKCCVIFSATACVYVYPEGTVEASVTPDEYIDLV